MQQMLDKHIFEFIIHARKGLSVPYLSEKWFEKIEHVLSKAIDMGMKVWIYDEDNWPSGYAGGKVLKDNADFRCKCLRMGRLPLEKFIRLLNDETESKIVCALIHDGTGYRVFDIKNNLQLTDEQIEITYFSQNYANWKPAYSEEYYIDVLNMNATKAFIRHTHEEYKRRFDKYFGCVIKGFFTDEAGFYNNLKLIDNLGDEDTLPWSDSFSEYFYVANGYYIEEKLPYLWMEEHEDGCRVKYDYYQTLCRMYKENFLDPQRQFCEENGLKLIGHLHMEDYLHYQIITQGDMMSAINSLSYAGTDRIDLNTQKINEKFISSCGHIYGKPRVMSETYALSGWGLTLEQMKRWVDWQYVRGINMLVPHAFYSSIEGERKWECPPSQFFQNPYWKFYSRFSDYVRRLSYVLSQGSHVADIAMYYPLSTAYDMITPDNWGKVIEVDKLVQQVTFALLDNQYDFDFVNDEVVLDGSIDNGAMCIRDEKYRILLLPGCTNLKYEVLDKILDFVINDGVAIFIGAIPGKCLNPEMQGNYTLKLKKLMDNQNFYFIHPKLMNEAYTYKFDVKKLQVYFDKILKPDFSLMIKDNNIKYLHRRISEWDVYFVINEDKCSRNNTLIFRATGTPFELDLETGKRLNLEDSWVNNNCTYIPVSFSEYGSKLFIFDSSKEHELNIKRKMADKTELVQSEARLQRLPVSFKITGMWNININNRMVTADIKPWADLGFPDYSGECTYENAFNIDSDCILKTCCLELGEVYDCSEVWINNSYIGFCTWKPYSFDITGKLVPGRNLIKIKVCNTLINEIEKVPQLSGLLGDVKLTFC